MNYHENSAAITPRLGAILIVLALLIYPLRAVQSSSLLDAPELTSDSHTATGGFYHLKWQKNGLSGATYELQEATDAEFAQATTIYQGPDRGTLVSGRPDGRYFYRVRITDQGKPASPWSSPLAVTVRHHPLSRALGFFVAGVIVFLATLGLILSGVQQSQRKRPRDS